MSVARTVGFVCVLLFLASPALAQDKPADLLVGKWEFKEKQPGREFTISFEKGDGKEGKLKLEASGLTLEGSYKLLSDAEMEVSMKAGNDTVRQKLKFKVTKEELETTDEQGKVETFKRVK